MPLGGANAEEVMAGLRRSAPFLKARLARLIDLRHMPNIAFAFGQEAWLEAGKVSWPTRKETIQTTLVVFAFVVIMALVLFAIDSTLAWLVKLATGRSEG